MYLYRFDPLGGLREQVGDPVLRARRVREARGTFDHYQVIDELPNLSQDHGAYRFCFWKNWASALRHFPRPDPHTDPRLMQRIRADHPALKKFKRDHDEYLLDDAWIFWQTAPASAARPNWSDDGIPHRDIEVLHPNGYWEPLATTAMLGDPDLIGWECIVQHVPHTGPSPTYVRNVARAGDRGVETWVLIRQKTGPWISVLNDEEMVAACIAHYFPKVVHLDPGRTRWALSLECSDRVLAFEIFPTFAPVWRSGFLYRLFNGKVLDRRQVRVDLDRKRYRHLDDVELGSLYRDFGIAEVLRLHLRYLYSDGFLSSIQPTIRHEP